MQWSCCLRSERHRLMSLPRDRAQGWMKAGVLPSASAAKDSQCQPFAWDVLHDCGIAGACSEISSSHQDCDVLPSASNRSGKWFGWLSSGSRLVNAFIQDLSLSTFFTVWLYLQRCRYKLTVTRSFVLLLLPETRFVHEQHKLRRPTYHTRLATIAGT